MKEREYKIPLIKIESDVNKKFDFIFNEINELKSMKELENKFQKLEKLLFDLKIKIYKKLDENLNAINILTHKLEENKSNLEDNKKEINILKNEIFNLIHFEMQKKIYEMYLKDNLKGKGFFLKY